MRYLQSTTDLDLQRREGRESSDIVQALPSHRQFFQCPLHVV